MTHEGPGAVHWVPPRAPPPRRVTLGLGEAFAAGYGAMIGLIAVVAIVALQPRQRVAAPAIEIAAELAPVDPFPPLPEPSTRTAPYCEAAADGTLKLPKLDAPRLGIMVLPFAYAPKSE